MPEEVERLLAWLQLLKGKICEADIALEEIRVMEKDHRKARGVIEKRYSAVYALLDSVREDPATPPWLQERVWQRIREIESGTPTEANGQAAQEEPSPGDDYGMFRRARGEG